MKYLWRLYVKLWDWWRPIYYGRILKRPTTTLQVHSTRHGISSEVKHG